MNNASRNHRFCRALTLLTGFALASVCAFAANVDWSKVLSQNPKNQTALYAMGKTLNVPPTLVHTRLLANSLLRESRSTFGSVTSFFTLIDCLVALGDFSTARKSLAAYLAMNPRSLKPILSMAYSYYLAGNHVKAIEWYEQGIARIPQARDGYLTIEDFDQILNCYHGKMLCLMALKEYNQAMKVGKYVLSISPENYYATLRIANILYIRNDFQMALRCYSRYPDDTDCRLGMGLCYFRLKNYLSAAPFLKASVLYYPQNPELLSALRYLNDIEINELQKVTSASNDLDKRGGIPAFERLAILYELNGEFAKAADVLRKIVSHPPQFKELLRIAGDESAAGRFEEAGTTYLKAVPLSSDPWATSLAAVDCFLYAGNAVQARRILLGLQTRNPAPELWPFWGRLSWLMKDTVSAKKYFELMGSGAEKRAATLSDPRSTYLYAIDCYLDAMNSSRAKLLLEQIDSFAPGNDLDSRFVRYFTQRKEYESVVARCARYPSDPVMQNAKGWAYINLGDIRNAERTFRQVMRQYPGNAGAKAGLEYTDRSRPWELFLGYTGIAYGGYQDGRGLVTESLRYAHQSTSTTLSHTRTAVKNPRSGASNFAEDLYAGKLSYQASPYVGLQLHGMTFQNNDADTNGSSVFGGRAVYSSDASWMVGAEFDSSKYRSYHASQFSPFFGYQFNRSFRADMKGFLISSGGARMRASQASRTSGGSVKATFTPNDRFLLTLGGLLGERRLGVDADSLYAFNTLDLYESGFFAKVLVTPSTRWKLYLGFSMDRFVSERLDAANETAGTFLAQPRRTSRTYTVGGMFPF